MFLQHTRVSSGGLTREQENPGGSRRSCPSKPIRLCRFVPGVHDIQQLLFLVDRRARPQITVGIISSAIFYPLQFPANFFVTHGISSPSSTSHRRFCSSWEFTFRLFFSITKVCPDSLNLLNAGDSFAGISSLSFRSLFSPNQGLDCFDLESSRVFSVRFPESSLFQIRELLHFIEFRKKFINMQNQFCLNP
jgi:hypothetical protein